MAWTSEGCDCHYCSGRRACARCLMSPCQCNDILPLPEPAENGNNINKPRHYTRGSIECIDAIESATVGLDGIEAFAIGAAVKYLWRWKFKGGVEDLGKAKWYIDKAIAHATARTDGPNKG